MQKICKHCGKPFITNNPQKMYCNRQHYRPCPICGKLVAMIDNDFSRAPKCCSSTCSHELRKRKIKKRKCIFCGKEFQPKSGVALVCDDKHFRKCEICGKEFELSIHNKDVTTCSHECTNEKLRRRSQERYGTDHPMQSAEVQHNFHQAMINKYGVAHALQKPEFSGKQQETAYQTNMERNGVPYACLLPQCMNAQGKIISNNNRTIADRLHKTTGYRYTFEHRIEDSSYDICVQDIRCLIEVDPSYTHSSIENHWGTKRNKMYHVNKTQKANKAGYRCIHIFDWDDIHTILASLQPKQKIYARNCKVVDISLKDAQKFLSRYHLQGTCRGQFILVGLMYQDELVEIMTFGKSRYNKNYDWELLRLCTLPQYQVIGGASKLFKYAVYKYQLHNIISYCDLAKFTGEVYEKIGMKRVRVTPPQEVWSKGSEKITANLLRQRGFDQLFHTNFGKGTSNEELMLQHGWLPVYDCGQAVYEYK